MTLQEIEKIVSDPKGIYSNCFEFTVKNKSIKVNYCEMGYSFQSKTGTRVYYFFCVNNGSNVWFCKTFKKLLSKIIEIEFSTENV